MSLNRLATKRGDTLIEVMFAIAVFTFIVIMTFGMMNLGLATAESSLELSVTRHEMNAQAEALRFVHSSYISEKTLPLRENAPSGQAYQQYNELWKKIVENAVSPSKAEQSGLLDLADLVNNRKDIGANGCDRIYDTSLSGTSPLSMVNAFVLNTRDLSSVTYDSMGRTQVDVGVSYIGSSSNPGLFQPAPLNARIIYSNARGQTTDDQYEYFDSNDGYLYNRIAAVEGLFVFAVSDSENPENAKYYDFYIETCWYGMRTTSATTLDTVIRLYNPENVK